MLQFCSCLSSSLYGLKLSGGHNHAHMNAPMIIAITIALQTLHDNLLESQLSVSYFDHAMNKSIDSNMLIYLIPDLSASMPFVISCHLPSCRSAARSPQTQQRAARGSLISLLSVKPVFFKRFRKYTVNPICVVHFISFDFI